jgi:hypothetical protein
VLGIPVGTVKSRLFHAFRKLRGLLAGYVAEEGGATPATTPAGSGGPNLAVAGAVGLLQQGTEGKGDARR